MCSRGVKIKQQNGVTEDNSNFLCLGATWQWSGNANSNVVERFNVGRQPALVQRVNVLFT